MKANSIGMPDFVFSTSASPFTNRFRDQILSYDCMFPPPPSIYLDA